MTLLEKIERQLRVLPPEKQGEVLDFIASLQEKAQSTESASAEAERKKRLKEALDTLARLGTFAGISDPAEWQRQVRKDRPLPGREA